jgi:hypothetical protein
MKQRCFTKKRILLCLAAVLLLTAAVVRSNLSPRERIPAAVIGIKLLQEMQQSSTERKQASCRTQDMTQFCG